MDTLYSRRQTSNAKRTETSIAGADEQIKFLNEDITEKMKQANSVNDSIAYYDQKIIEYKASDVSSEVGPLKYLADLTGIAMNQVVNILVLLIIFVFDPMAIALLIGVNQLTMMEKGDSDLKNEKIKIPNLRNLFRKKKDEDEEIVEEQSVEEKIVEEKIDSHPVVQKKEEPKRWEPVFNDDNQIEENIEEQEEKFDPKKNEYHFEDCPEGFSQEKVDLDISDIKEGIRVYHNTFGEGVVTRSDSGRVFIKFDIGIKELIPEYANLKEIKCVKSGDGMESVPYLDFVMDDPEIQEIRGHIDQIKQPELPIESEETEPESLVDNVILEESKKELEEPEIEEENKPVEKKTKFLQKIWRGKKIV